METHTLRRNPGDGIGGSVFLGLSSLLSGRGLRREVLSTGLANVGLRQDFSIDEVSLNFARNSAAKRVLRMLACWHNPTECQARRNLLMRKMFKIMLCLQVLPRGTLPKAMPKSINGIVARLANACLGDPSLKSPLTGCDSVDEDPTQKPSTRRREFLRVMQLQSSFFVNTMPHPSKMKMSARSPIPNSLPS